MDWLRRWVRWWLGVDEILDAIERLHPRPIPVMPEPRLLHCGHNATSWATSKRDGTTECLHCYKTRTESAV